MWKSCIAGAVVGLFCGIAGSTVTVAVLGGYSANGNVIGNSVNVSGGTLTGVAEYLKAQNPAVRVVAVEPATSAVLEGGAPGPHGLQGIGAGFVPATLNTSAYDEVIPVTDEEAFAARRALVRLDGVLAGISSGAALHAATVLARREENAGKLIVALLPDTGERYLQGAQ